ncbi:MAG: type VI secretion system tube protein TssD [Bacteroidota bacterium]
MSSFKAEITIGSNTYKVLDADISYYQHTRGGGMPSSDIQGGTFTIRIESSGGPQYDQLAEWMFGKTSMQKGILRFYKKDGISKLFDFEFYDAYCIRYSEHFSSTNDQPMVLTLTITPGIVRMRNIVRERPWKVSETGNQKTPEVFFVSDKTPKKEPEIDRSVDTIEEKKTQALEFYKKSGFTERKALEHMEGIDFSKPVEIVKLKKGTVVQQWVGENGTGNYFTTEENGSSQNLGIDYSKRSLRQFTLTEDVEVLKSTAADYKGFKGGGVQFFGTEPKKHIS